MKRFLVWIFFWVGKITLWPIQWLYFRKRVYYEDKKTTSRRIKGGALIVSNHKGLMDFPMSMFIFPFHKLYCLMSELIYNHGKLLAHLTNIVGGIRVDRKNYDFGFIASNFIEQLRVSKFFFKYILSIEIVRGHLNDCDENIYLKDDTIPKIWQNYTGEYFFRLDVYNNETIHAHLDLFFVNIIIPYTEINRRIMIPHLSIDNKEIYVYIISVFYLLFVFIIYAAYLLSEIKIVNNHIYKTKNLLTLIPIHILSAQNNIKELLNL